MDIRLDVEVEGTIAALRAISHDIENRAIASALNKTATTVRAEAARMISREMPPLARVGINQARKYLRIIRANRGNLLAIVQAEGMLLVPLIKTRIPIPPGAFVQKMPSGHRGIFVRAQTSKVQVLPNVNIRRKRVRRSGADLPIAELMISGVKATFAQEKIKAALRRVAVDRFAVVIAQELRRFGGN